MKNLIVSSVNYTRGNSTWGVEIYKVVDEYYISKCEEKPLYNDITSNTVSSLLGILDELYAQGK